MGFFNLFNREPRRSGGVFIGAADRDPKPDAKAKKPQGDPLAGLTKKTIKTDLRIAINKGLFARPAWTFHELARTCSELGDKVSFWKSKVGALPWSIRIDADAEADEGEKKKRAEAQRDALKAHYDNLKDLRKAIRHMATARFYGFAVLKIAPDSLIPIDPWNCVHDIEWKGDTAPSYKWHFNERADYQPRNAATLPVMDVPEYAVRESDEENMVALMLLALRVDANTDFRDKNLEEASKNQVIILTGDGLPDPETDPDKYNKMIAALKDARDGKSTILAKGDPECPTEVVKPEAAKGLPFYNETLDKLDQLMTKAVTGGLLTMLSMDTGIGNGASDNHADTLADILEDDAKGICETFWEAIDRPVLTAAGLLAEGERPLAWFDLGLPDRKDSAAAAQTLATLRSARYNVTDEQASDMLGFDVETAEAAQGAQDGQQGAFGVQGGQGQGQDATTAQRAFRAGFPASLSALMNRSRETLEERALRDLDAGFIAFLDELAKETGDGVPDDKWRQKIMEAIQDADPSDLADSDTFRKYLERKILSAERKEL